MKILVILLVSIVIVNGNAIPETEIAEELETIGAEAHGRMDAEADGRMDEEEDAESDEEGSITPPWPTAQRGPIAERKT